MDNDDLLNSRNSFHKFVGVDSPKATVSFLPKGTWYVPLVSLSFGQAFLRKILGWHRNGRQDACGDFAFVSTSRRAIHKTDLKLTLGQPPTAPSWRRSIDTGLQFNEDRVACASCHLPCGGTAFRSLQSSISKAARDLSLAANSGGRERSLTFWERSKLPFRMRARGEFEYVGTKSGTNAILAMRMQICGCCGEEFRGALVRPFHSSRLETGVNFLIASGYADKQPKPLRRLLYLSCSHTSMPA